jgi:hypothetical protein
LPLSKASAVGYHHAMDRPNVLFLMTDQERQPVTYDLDADPCEARNLAADPDYATVREALLGVLARERSRKRLTRRHPVPYADVEPLPPPAQGALTLPNPPAWLVRLVDRATRL